MVVCLCGRRRGAGGQIRSLIDARSGKRLIVRGDGLPEEGALAEQCNRFARSKTFAGLVLIAISIYAVVEALDTCQV